MLGRGYPEVHAGISYSTSKERKLDTVAQTPLWPLVVYFGSVLFVAGAMLGLSYVLGERHRGPTTGDQYESGIPPTGSARLRFDVKFYLVATFFVIFDLEAAFLLAWAVAARELGWRGYIEVAIFVGLLLVALLYLWRTGALEWGSTPRGIPVNTKEKDDVTPA
jgi:NADH-quinone oxidoreductase subunit A